MAIQNHHIFSFSITTFFGKKLRSLLFHKQFLAPNTKITLPTQCTSRFICSSKQLYHMCVCVCALVFKVLFYIISTLIWCECTDNKKGCFPRESETNSTYYVCILRQECNTSLPTIFRHQQRTITCVKERSWKMFFCPRILGFSISILVPGVNRSRGRVWTTVPWPFHILTYTVKVLQMASYFLSGVKRGWLPVKSRSHN